MLEFLSLGLAPVWLHQMGVLKPMPSPPLGLSFPLGLRPVDPVASTLLAQFVQQYDRPGLTPDDQGLWVQTDRQLLGNHQGDLPLPAASLTKVATTLAALKTWKPHHRFVTQVYHTGTLREGELQGDLVLVSQGDPSWGWPGVIQMAQTLQQRGIRQIQGNLVIVGSFTWAGKADVQDLGAQVLAGFNVQTWPLEATMAYDKMSSTMPPPQLRVTGQIQTAVQVPENASWLMRQDSPPLHELLRHLNVESENILAEQLVAQMGGMAAMLTRLQEVVAVPVTEIQLQNGSGLGVDNRLSPRAVVGLFQALDRHLQHYDLALADVLPVAGQDLGTLEERQLPPGTIVKTGSLWNVSALAGGLPTLTHGWVWFAFINGGDNLSGFRRDQDALLQALQQQWGSVTMPPHSALTQPK
ncbi:D-alanyl-D-alanine carboxypeptidase [Synechococcales cyanobacterium C]|uniref:D-alanyl-D-alanine carboxypeptidase n=1 Tax=Petrachloros mirabilis ULC683 TaxID=2781853 RepID=A0A8K2A8N2_9CYAN|nr:D-alanyl-D-alanine carboxypeptidase [Petrachloros mirabilis]NCJ07115.1 D-alanyl-D-alanine carboxypeptidase [Petrachloros mirabilis ULC683]